MGAALAVADEYSREQLELLKATVAKGTSDLEFNLFLATARRLKMDPFRRQIYCMPTWEGSGENRTRTFKSVVSIDGFRSIADSTGEYQGQTKPEWFDIDANGGNGAWVDVWFGKNPPVAARIGVRRATFAEPLYRVARYDAYVQTTKDGNPNAMWRKMGAEQLLKCAESLALRAAFPGPLSGVYTDDEMGQGYAGGDDELPTKPEPKREPDPAPGAPRDPDTSLRFKWTDMEKLHGTLIIDARPEQIVMYINYLTSLANGKGTADYKARVTAHRRAVQEIFEEVRARETRAQAMKVAAELAADRSRRALGTPEGMKSIGDLLQDMVDGQLADPSDTQQPQDEAQHGVDDH